MWPWTKLFGTGLFIIRLPSVLFGVASVLLVYALARLEEDRETALLSAGLLAFNGFHLFWSQIARPYSMTCFVGLLSTFLLLLLLRREKGKRVLLSLYLITTFYGLASYYYFWPIFAVQILWVLLGNGSTGTLTSGVLRSQLFLLILASPFVALAIFQSFPSHLASNTLLFFKEYLRFGFLFLPVSDVPIQYVPSPTAKFVLLCTGGLLFLVGLLSERKRTRTFRYADTIGPSLLQLALVSTFAVLCIGGFLIARFFHWYNPHKAILILASGLLPLLILLFSYLIQRRAFPMLKLEMLLKRVMPEGPYSLIAFLAIVL
jgi:4-amino-4-deoxy-L-arabinose transferase-like glycosyltransferase